MLGDAGVLHLVVPERSQHPGQALLAGQQSPSRLHTQLPGVFVSHLKWCCSEYVASNTEPAEGCAEFDCIYMPCSQDPEEGGISDRPEDEVDVFHTFFGLAGLSLMGFPGLSPIDPVYALPTEVVQRVKLKHQAAS